MASIVKRKNKYAVVYYYTDSNGNRKQKWEPFDTQDEALKRKAQVENHQEDESFIVPDGQTIADFMQDFVSLYGEHKWSVASFDNNMGLIKNYVNPLIGKMKVTDVTPKVIDSYYKKLRSMPPVAIRGRKPKSRYLSEASISRVHRLLRCAFSQAVRWEMITRNPFELVLVKKPKYKPREIWTADMIRKALDCCKNGRLYIAINLSFACSLREGEILGLTWDNVDISDKAIAADNAHVKVEKELMRCSKMALERLNEKDVYFTFPPVMPGNTTRIVLKKPKTDSSIRKVWLPKTVARILKDWKKAQNDLKDYLGDEYQDYNLVVAYSNGRPCEGRMLLKDFKKLREEAKLPNVVFHSLRHSSTTYKLKLNHGDLKATQGDTGHAEIDMITKVYAHILDDDRKINAQKFEREFYAKPEEQPQSEESKNNALDVNQLIEQIKASPELLSALAGLVAGQESTP